MKAEHRRIIVRDGIVGGAIANLLINAAIGGLLVIGRSRVPLWGLNGVAADTIATSFLLPLLYCLIATPLIRRQIRERGISRLDPAEAWPMIRFLPERARLRGVVLGAIAAAIAAPPTVFALAATIPSGVSATGFVVFKALFAAALAAVAGPFIAAAALAETRSES